ncbi:MAG TPA: alpha/beta fold hydrolase [Gammaproteobacteria bacterium]|nr:alpha/beta fold hydrolase [Gammaproteobacteria bacterium]
MQTLVAADRAEWRAWLAANHASAPRIWLVYFKKDGKRAEQRGVSYEESLQEALCFGWIDSLIKRIDDERSWMAYLASAGFDVFSMDMTGHGRSTRPHPMTQHATTVASDWADIDAVVEYLRKLRGVERVSLIGWSLGGPRAGGYAAQHPEKVAKLVVLARRTRATRRRSAHTQSCRRRGFQRAVRIRLPRELAAATRLRRPARPGRGRIRMDADACIGPGRRDLGGPVCGARRIRRSGAGGLRPSARHARRAYSSRRFTICRSRPTACARSMTILARSKKC